MPIPEGWDPIDCTASQLASVSNSEQFPPGGAGGLGHGRGASESFLVPNEAKRTQAASGGGKGGGISIPAGVFQGLKVG